MQTVSYTKNPQGNTLPPSSYPQRELPRTDFTSIHINKPMPSKVSYCGAKSCSVKNSQNNGDAEFCFSRILTILIFQMFLDYPFLPVIKDICRFSEQTVSSTCVSAGVYSVIKYCNVTGVNILTSVVITQQYLQLRINILLFFKKYCYLKGHYSKLKVLQG